MLSASASRQSMICRDGTNYVTPFHGVRWNYTWILGDADAPELLIAEEDGRDALVLLGVIELGKYSLWYFRQHSACKN